MAAILCHLVYFFPVLGLQAVGYIASLDTSGVVFNRARGGETWASLLSHLHTDLQLWRSQAEARELEVGRIIVWLNGNEAYSRLTGIANVSEATLWRFTRAATQVLQRLVQEGRPVAVLGPLPRPEGEVAGVPWDGTMAYRLERRLVALRRAGRVDAAVEIYPVGRALCKKIAGEKRLENYYEFYDIDYVHLTRRGYLRVSHSPAFPRWLRVHARV